MVKSWLIELASTVTMCATLIYPTNNALAQNITLDGTLGTKGTLSGPNYEIPQSVGQTVGKNLFHSFGKFNLNANEAAIFSSADNIRNILSRVTGGSPSSIDGLIRTLGNDVNLFFINPNGIIFGKNARLDISGSFFASTADSLVFDNGLEFSATNLQAASLLEVNITPGLQYGKNHPSRTIKSSGNLTAGQDLELFAGNLDLQGQLQAGRNLSLKADTVKVRDSVTDPFIAAAGGKLSILGSESVDILALNHPNSGLFSTGDMVLSSANPVVGDIHFWSGGNFQIQKLDGSLGNFYSFDDPVIRASGDVSFDSYTGASLHIFAGGSINVAGEINITGTDTTENSIQEQVILSDGTTVVDIDGSNKPTLDIRAGTTAFGKPEIIGNTDVFSPVAITDETRTTGNISINRITNNGGLVFLTNQDRPNGTLAGKITIGSIDTSSDLGGGDVFIDSKNEITVNNLINVSGGDITTFDFSGNGGDINLFANNNINILPNAVIASFGLLGGNIALKSKTSITAQNSAIQNLSVVNTPDNSGSTGGNINIQAHSFFLSSNASVGTFTFGIADTGNVKIQTTESLNLTEGKIQALTLGDGNAGSITIDTPSMNLTQGGRVEAVTLADGNAGSITIKAQSVEINGNNPINGSSSGLFSSVGLFGIGRKGGEGNGGNLTIETDSLRVTNGGRISSDIFGTSAESKAGSINIKANSVEIIGFNPENKFLSGIFAAVTPFSSGSAGNVTVEADTLRLEDGGFLSASTFGEGNAGSLKVQAKLVEVIGIAPSPSNVPSRLRTNVVDAFGSRSTGNGGDLVIETETLRVADGGEILANTEGDGNAGTITIKAQLVELMGKSAANGFPSGLFTKVNSGARGTGGNLNINTGILKVADGAAVSASTSGDGDAGSIIVTANSLEATNGGQLRTTTAGKNNAGNITLNVEDKLTLTGSETGIFANTIEGSIGNGGSIFIDPRTVTIFDGATIAVDSQGEGIGGDIQLTAGLLTLDNGSISAETRSNTGGNINLNLQDLLLLRNGSKISTTAGNQQFGGDGGNIDINSPFIVAVPKENSDITANAFSGTGGRVNITTNGIFGIVPRERPTQKSDITASSELGVSGEVTINTPEVDPSRGLVELPSNLVDASQQIAQGCTPRGRETASRFIATGRGGLPLSPNEPLRGRAVITNWVKLPDHRNQQTREIQEEMTTKSTPETIVEAKDWIVNSRGEVELIAQAPAVNSNISFVQSNFYCNVSSISSQ